MRDGWIKRGGREGKREREEGGRERGEGGREGGREGGSREEVEKINS